jgi:hypothetical protein
MRCLQLPLLINRRPFSLVLVRVLSFSLSKNHELYVVLLRLLKTLAYLRENANNTVSATTTTKTKATTKATGTAKCNWELRAQRTGRH